MSPTTIEPDAQEAEIRRRSDELVEITKAITTTEGDLRELRDERRVIYRALLDAGVSQAQVGKLAGVTSMAVAWALGYRPEKKSA